MTTPTQSWILDKIVAKLGYWLWCARHRLNTKRQNCPACGCQQRTRIDSKWIVSKLFECEDCGLLFRAPTQTEQENSEFYAAAYKQGFTTDLPDESQLRALMATGFFGTERWFGPVVHLLRALDVPQGSRVYDYGCSWGYGSWQLRSAGWDVIAYELSRSRSQYAADQLNVQIIQPDAVPTRSLDVFFSAHVIEHVTNPSDLVQYAMGLLRPGGLFVATTPNGSTEYKALAPQVFSRLWGRVHPQLITPRWIASVAADRPYLVTGMPFDNALIEQWASQRNVIGNLNTPEIAFAIRAD